MADRVLAFDWMLWKNDKDTPPAVTWKPATALKRYEDEDGRKLADLDFDHRGISRGHFSEHFQEIPV